MFAIQIRDDDRHTMAWTQVDAPEPGPEEALVEVHATAVNRADLLQRRGLYPPPEGASDIPGLEASGVVAEVGERVTRVAPGDRVCCLLAGGGYAQFVTTHADMLLKLPENLDLTRAAAIPEVYYTAYLNLVIEGAMQHGATVLLHAGASGVGTAAIQICRLYDAAVLATASAPKLAGLREMGVVAIDRHEEDFAARVAEETEGRGVDVILDPVGGGYLGDDVQSLAARGTVVIIGLLGGTEGQLSLAPLLRKRLRIVGSVLRSRSLAEKLEITARFRDDVWPHVGTDGIWPVVDRVLPIEEVEAAHALLERNETFGKVVLSVRESRRSA